MSGAVRFEGLIDLIVRVLRTIKRDGREASMRGAVGWKPMAFMVA
jgi:hypothetical protein